MLAFMLVRYKAWGSLLGRQLAERDIVVACLDYRYNLCHKSQFILFRYAIKGMNIWACLLAAVAWSLEWSGLFCIYCRRFLSSYPLVSLEDSIVFSSLLVREPGYGYIDFMFYCTRNNHEMDCWCAVSRI